MRPLEVVYEDNHLLIVVKPPNVPSQADDSRDMDMLTMCKAYIKERYQKPGDVYLGLVHRLDRPAAGLMVFARTSKAAARLQHQMEAGVFRKRYRAVTQGIPEGGGKLIDELLKGEKNIVRVVRQGTPGAKHAELVYRIIAGNNDRAIVEIDLLTGRPHQIRVQFASRQTPLYGDAKYGDGGGQLALYARELFLEHPTKKEPLHFISDTCDARFEKLLSQ